MKKKVMNNGRGRHEFEGARPQRVEMVEQNRATVVVPETVECLKAAQKATTMIVDDMESGSGT